MANRYLTIDEAAELKGVAPAAIHDAICSGSLPTIVLYRAGRDEHRLVGRWELEQWAAGMDSNGGRLRPSHRAPHVTVLSINDRTPFRRDPVLS
ncbi:MAG TPA: hypothetical protein VGM51_16760 [Armatimonadota bacterium]|jgi:hypothetical protein